MFKGVYTALVTPFKDDGAIDLEKFSNLIQRQKDSGAAGVVIAGCTGESFTLNDDEKIDLLNEGIKYKSDNFKIIIGSGSSSTTKTISLSKRCENHGADALLLITPLGNKPSQQGLINHFKKVADNVNLPIILYNVPGRTGVKLETKSISELSGIKNIVAIKQAVASLDSMTEIRNFASELDLLSGEDTLTLPMLSIGGKGVVCTVSNILPKEMVALVDSYFKGDILNSEKIHKEIYSYIKMMFMESNPTPAKYCLYKMGLIDYNLREPLCSVSEETKKYIDEMLKKKKLI